MGQLNYHYFLCLKHTLLVLGILREVSFASPPENLTDRLTEEGKEEVGLKDLRDRERYRECINGYVDPQR